MVNYSLLFCLYSNKEAFLNVYCNLQYTIGHKCFASIWLTFGVLVMFTIWLLHIYSYLLISRSLVLFPVTVGGTLGLPAWTQVDHLSMSKGRLWMCAQSGRQICIVSSSPSVVDLRESPVHAWWLRDRSTTDHILFCASTHGINLDNSCQAESGYY